MIVCLGTTPALQRTLLLKSLCIDEVNRVSEVRTFASGKPVNVARVLTTIGQGAIVSGFVGGPAGEFIRQDLDVAGIAHRFVTVEPETRTCITLVDRHHGTATELVEEPAPVQAGAWEELLQTLRELLANASVLVLSGSLAPGGSEDFYANCVGLARESGVPSILDARGIPLTTALREQPYIIKPNCAELAETVGRAITSEPEILSAARELIARGAVWAVITQGAAGAVIVDARRAWRVSIPKITAINPIGSGDAMAAGLAAGLARGAEVPEAALLGSACAVANALTTQAGFVEQAEVERLLESIEVTPM